MVSPVLELTWAAFGLHGQESSCTSQLYAQGKALTESTPGGSTKAEQGPNRENRPVFERPGRGEEAYLLAGLLSGARELSVARIPVKHVTQLALGEKQQTAVASEDRPR